MSIGGSAFHFVSSLKNDCQDILLPPEEGCPFVGQAALSFALVRNTRGYIERVVHQINGCYQNGWFDACAVMIRRFLEILIIELFEAHNLAHKIKDQSGNFFLLSDLINITLSEPSWNLARSSKSALRKLKDIGNKSAHSRRFNAVRSDIDKIQSELRVTSQELIYLAKLK